MVEVRGEEGNGFSRPEMPLSPPGFCTAPGRDRDDTSAPTPHSTPSSFPCPVVNEKLPCRGRPAIVAV